MGASRTHSRTCERRRRRRPRPVVSHEVLRAPRGSFCAIVVSLILPLCTSFLCTVFLIPKPLLGAEERRRASARAVFILSVFFPPRPFSFFFCFLSRSIVVFLFSPEAASVRGARLIFWCSPPHLYARVPKPASSAVSSFGFLGKKNKNKIRERTSERERERESFV